MKQIGSACLLCTVNVQLSKSCNAESSPETFYLVLESI